MIFSFIYEHGNDGLWDNIIQVLAHHVEVGGDQILDDHDLHLRAGGALTSGDLRFATCSEGRRDVRKVYWLDIALDVLIDFVILIVPELCIFKFL